MIANEIFKVLEDFTNKIKNYLFQDQTKDDAKPPGVKEDNSKPKSKTAKKVQITYDNPDKYKGPVVEGWPPNSDRYAHGDQVGVRAILKYVEARTP